MKRSTSLVTIVAQRILGFAALAMLLQMGIVFADYWFDEPELGRLLVEHETTWIAEAYRASQRDGTPFPSVELTERYRVGAAGPATGDLEDREEVGEEAVSPGYFLRVRPVGGAILYSNCEDECTEHFLPLDLDPPSFWERMLEPVKPLTVAGGRTFPAEEGDAAPLLVDFASIDDPASLVGGVLLREMTDHMIVPMGLMLFVVIGATTLSIRKALLPVAAAARAADGMDPRGRIGDLPTAAMPSEVAHLTRAVNRALARVGELIRSQKLFSASIAHEIRTPVAIVKLELARIDHPRARRAEHDLENLTHTLEQLTALARLDAVEGESFSRQNLSRLARETVEDIAPLVFASGHSIEFRSDGDIEADVVPALVVILIRNLVENAVKHTGQGTSITVALEAPAVLTVSDTGEGFPVANSPIDTEIGAVGRTGSLGLGLKIVERIAALHGARLVVRSDPGNGTDVRIEFDGTGDSPCADGSPFRW